MAYVPQLYLSVIVTLFCLLPTATTTAAPNIFLRNANGPNNNNSNNNDNNDVADLSAAAIEDATARYENLRREYLEKNCPETWGPFPLASSVTATGNGDDVDVVVVADMACMCGLMHDLAVSQLMLMEANDDEETEVNDGTSSEIHSNIVSSSSSSEEIITPLEAWSLSRTMVSNVECHNGSAAGFPCQNIDLVAHLPLGSFRATNTGQAPRYANDLWGWTSDDREFIVMCVYEGHYFLEVTGLVPRLLGFLPTTTGASGWQHDVKIAGDYAYMGAEVEDHGIQIFDMKRLLTVQPETDCVSEEYCQEFEPDRVYHGTHDFPVGNTHNVVVHQEESGSSNFVYLVGGTNGCSGGLHIVDVSDPDQPTFVACFGDEGYVHDAQCVTYRGPDTRYHNREICFCYNGNKVAIVDVTNKSDIRVLSRTGGYTNVRYTHQGWLSSDQSHIVFGDEIDELKTDGIQTRTRTLVLGVRDLENPTGPNEFFGTTAAIDHNQYVARVSSSTKTIDMGSDGSGHGADMIFQANYKAGLRILQVLDYDTADFREIAYFDTFPQSDHTEFAGAWSVFPYFRSGLVAIGSISEGLFLVKPDHGAAMLVDDHNNHTDPPQQPITNGDCSDKKLRYKRRKNMDCTWVGTPKRTKKVKSRCKKVWKGAEISSYCPETCGSVGLGPCPDSQ